MLCSAILAVMVLVKDFEGLGLIHFICAVRVKRTWPIDASSVLVKTALTHLNVCQHVTDRAAQIDTQKT